jgi:hypothetical protein
MQSVQDFNELRALARTCRACRAASENEDYSYKVQLRATSAYFNSVDRLAELIERLATQPISTRNPRPTLDVLGEVLLAIEQAEAAFAEVEHGAGH